jgi:uncharacterized membrane protein
MSRTKRVLAKAYLLALLAFLALDACWLSLMGPWLYRPQLGGIMATSVDWMAAALFYPLYLVGLLTFAIAPALEAGGARAAAMRGAIFGLVAYATYDLTNQATLRGWPWSVTLADLAWGTVASSMAASAATWLTFPRSSRTGAR